jgi:hypothetical protein
MPHDLLMATFMITLPCALRLVKLASGAHSQIIAWVGLSNHLVVGPLIYFENAPNQPFFWPHFFFFFGPPPPPPPPLLFLEEWLKHWHHVLTCGGLSWPWVPSSSWDLGSQIAPIPLFLELSVWILRSIVCGASSSLCCLHSLVAISHGRLLSSTSLF